MAWRWWRYWCFIYRKVFVFKLLCFLVFFFFLLSFLLKNIFFPFFFLLSFFTLFSFLPLLLLLTFTEENRGGLQVLSGKESACQCRRHRFDPWVGKIPWRRKWQPTPAFLPGKSHGQRSLVGYSPWSHKESDMTEQLTLFTFLSLNYLLSLCLINKKSNSVFFPNVFIQFIFIEA